MSELSILIEEILLSFCKPVQSKGMHSIFMVNVMWKFK